MLSKMKMLVPALLVSLAAAPSMVMAAVPVAVSTELTEAKADVLVIGGLVFVVAIGIVLFKWFKRAL